MIERIQPIRPSLLRAIDALQAFYGRGSAAWNVHRTVDGELSNRSAVIHEELVRLQPSEDHGTRSGLAQLVWELSVDRREASLWILREFTPEASLIFLLCREAHIPLPRVLEADLTEANFRSLTQRIARLTETRLQLCEATSDADFAQLLRPGRQRSGIQNVICDWNLSAREHLMARVSGLRVIAPRLPSNSP